MYNSFELRDFQRYFQIIIIMQILKLDLKLVEYSLIRRGSNLKLNEF